MEPKLKYEFTEDEVSFLLNAVNSQETTGIQAAQYLVHIVNLLKEPLNLHELKKDRRNPDQKQKNSDK
ncbi:hypothetical protein KAR91_39110 [Candidatus Pacearchaeota archaeon]|nr:hypothetical protein [Candidatus Pacearchaeota archaeon]